MKLKPVLIGLSLGVVASTAQALPITFNVAGTFSPTTSRTYTSGGVTVTLSAFSTANSDGSGTFSTAKLEGFGSGGVGIRSTGESTSAPQHAADNSGKDEIFVFDFGSKQMDLLSFMIGYAREIDSTKTRNRADVDIYVGGSGSALTFGTMCLSGCVNTLTSAGFSQYHFENVAEYSGDSESSTKLGRYIVIGSEKPIDDGMEDFFKLKSITVEERRDPPSEVPAPGALLLTALGLFGMRLARHKH